MFKKNLRDMNVCRVMNMAICEEEGKMLNVEQKTRVNLALIPSVVDQSS